MCALVTGVQTCALPISLVVAGIMMFFQSANMNSKTNEAVGQLGAVQQAVRSVYAGQPTYTGLNAQALADTRSLPTKMVVGSGATASLRHAFNGTITVAPAQIAGGSAGKPGTASCRDRGGQAW